MEAVASAVAGAPDAAEQARQVAGVYRFAMSRSGPLERAYEYHVRIAPTDGGATVTVLDEPADVDLGIEADYARWKQLLTGHLDVTRSILTRKLKVSGGVGAAIKRIGAVSLIEHAVDAVDTIWPDEA